MKSRIPSLLSGLWLLASGLCHAQAPTLVRPEVRIEQMAKEPAKWTGKTVRVSGPIESITKAKDGTITGTCAGIRVTFTAEAYDYQQRCMKVLRLAVYQGTLQLGPDGKPVLTLTKGLNFAR